MQEGVIGSGPGAAASSPWGYSGPDKSSGSKRGTVGSGTVGSGTVGSGTVGASPAKERRRYTSGVKRPVGQSVAWGADDDTTRLSHSAASLGADISGASVSISCVGVGAGRDHAPAARDVASLSLRKKSSSTRAICDPL